MSGLYTGAEIARYFGCRSQEVGRMIREDGLPVVMLPGEKEQVKKITLHGLHAWMKKRHSGTAFMTVDELAAEIEAANGMEQGARGLESDGLARLRACVELVFEAVSREMRKEAA